MRSIFQRLKGKNFRDYVAYGKRKFYLERVKKTHRRYGYDYYFSEKYIKKHCKSGDLNLLAKNFLNSKNGLFGDINNLRSRLNEFSDIAQHSVNNLISYADSSTLHQFNLLGSGVKNLNFPFEGCGSIKSAESLEIAKIDKVNEFLDKNYSRIDWHVDFKSGYRWNNSQYYPESRNYVNFPGADIKMPWELSRIQHLPSLAIAYLLTNKSKYAEEVYSQIIDWIAYNPLCKGPNWNCPMDVGIRAANWLVALELVTQYQSTKNLKKLEFILASLIQHLDYLWNNFEWSSKLTSNHYLSDLVGFLFCIVYIPELKKKKRFKNFVQKDFAIEIEKQMYQDGMNAEGSLPYHRLVLELFVYSYELSRRNSICFGNSYKEQLDRSLEFTNTILSFEGKLPQIGDNDGGLFLKFGQFAIDDFSHLRSFSGIDLSEEDKIKNNSNSFESVLLGKAPKYDNKKPYFANFKDSGIAIFKDKELYFSFYYGLNGQKGNGGHCHNDRLSFTLSYKGQDIFVDPGTGVYTANPSLRNLFRRTECHNTLIVDTQEQNRFPLDGNLFRINEDITDVKAYVTENKDSILISSQHNGYERLKLGANHQREIELFKSSKRLRIIDKFDAKVRKKVVFILRKHEGVTLEQGLISSKFFSMYFEGARSITSNNFDFSVSYGYIEKNGCLKIDVTFDEEIVTYIELR